MLSIGILAVIVLCIGGIVWMRRRRWHAYTTPSSPGTIPRETLALRAFAQGNSCLAEGKFTEAIAAFQQALEIEPKHPCRWPARRSGTAAASCERDAARQ